MSTSEKRVVLGMSGGVDSSVAAVLLMRAGYEVVGATCRFVCDDAFDVAAGDARAVCERLGIEHVIHDVTSEFSAHIVEPFVRAYADGLTPSPCVVCNREVKIPSLLELADRLGCAKVATGHYARIVAMDNGRYGVLNGLDHRKDQSYMLSMLTQDQLSRLVFPLGAMTKTDVRLIAAELGLEVAEKAESQDICFAPHGYRDLLQSFGITGEPGDIVDCRGRVVGRHSGLVDYTIGQRKGIGVAASEPLYVLRKDAAANTLVVGFKEETYIEKLVVSPVNWQPFSEPEFPLEAMVKLRYRSEPVACIIEPMDDGRALVRLLSQQPTTAPGQYAVFSCGSAVYGGALIEEVG